MAAYERDLRKQLRLLSESGRPTNRIVDIRGTGIQDKAVANALRAAVGRLGPLDAARTAIVTSSGIAKLQATRVANPDSRVFTAMVLARDWIMKKQDAAPLGKQGAASIAVHSPSEGA